MHYQKSICVNKQAFISENIHIAEWQKHNITLHKGFRPKIKANKMRRIFIVSGVEILKRGGLAWAANAVRIRWGGTTIM